MEKGDKIRISKEEKDVLAEGVQQISVIIRDLMNIIVKEKEVEDVIQDTDSQSR